MYTGNVRNRKWFKKLKVGEKAYRMDRHGLIYEFEVISEHCYRSRCLTPTGERLPLVVNCPPPKPFKSWDDYKKTLPQTLEVTLPRCCKVALFLPLPPDYSLCKCATCPLFAKRCLGRCFREEQEKRLKQPT